MMVESSRSERGRRTSARWRRAVTSARARQGMGLLSVIGCILIVGGVTARGRARPRPAAFIPTASVRTPFGSSMAAATHLYIRAGIASKQQLDATEEWDPDALNGSAPEQYRRSLVAGAPELGLAESAAREAETRAGSSRERYRAMMLLARIECDMGHHRAELEVARKLVALQPRDPGALSVLERAAKHTGQPALAVQAGSKLDPLH